MPLRTLTFAPIAVAGMGMTLVLAPVRAAEQPHQRVADDRAYQNAGGRASMHVEYANLAARPVRSS